MIVSRQPSAGAPRRSPARVSRVAALMFAGLVSASVGTAQERKVVCYVSHDFEHSESVLKAFETATGIKVEAVSDTEDNKTIGLANRLIAEAGKTKADVFWNNEAGQAVRLKSKGLLETYVSPNAATIPAAFKDPDGAWTGFAARARVLIYNTRLVQPADLPRRHADLADPKFAARTLMARPLTGTTLTHAGVLFARDGADSTLAFYRALLDNGVQFEKGNAYVMKQVAAGVRPFGVTDTDDANVSLRNGDSTAIAYLDQGADDVGALLIPNAAMILKGAPHPVEARALVDFLLRPETEALLAAGGAAQVPLHPGVARPPHVKGLDELKVMTVDWAAAGRAIDERFDALRKMFEEGGAPKSRRLPVVGLSALIAVTAVVLMRRKRRAESTAA